MQRVLMLCAQSLLSEGLKDVLDRIEDVELLGPWTLDADVLARLPDARPGVVLLVVEKDEHELASAFTAQMLECYPNLPVIHVGADQNVLRVFTSYTLPARTTDLLDIIRTLALPPSAGTARDADAHQPMVKPGDAT